MNWRVPFCCTLFAFINLFTVSTGAARLAGVLTKRIATALTLFNTFILVSRMANLLMGPEIGRLADIARTHHNTLLLEHQFRLILGAATIGCILATLLIPTFVEIFKRGISAFERTGSLPLLFLGLINPRRSNRLLFLFVVSILSSAAFVKFVDLKVKFIHPSVGTLAAEGFLVFASVYIVLASLSWIFHPEIFRPPSWMGVKLSHLSHLPKDFLVLNIFGQAFWTVGPMAAIFASAHSSDYVAAAVQLSGIITGVSTILLTVFVDPKAALITDQVAHGAKPEEDIKAVILFLSLGNVLGTLIAQIIFNPAAWLIGTVASHI